MSLLWPVRPDLAGENTRIGGLALKTLKKLKGAKLALPCASSVEANAIGRGPMAPNKSWCKRCTVSSFLISLLIIHLIIPEFSRLFFPNHHSTF